MNKKLSKFIREWGIFIGIILLLILSRIFIWSNVIVEGHSMDPTLADKERLMMVKVIEPKRFDLVITHEKNPDQDIVKRVIGMPGDKLSFNNDQLTINGKKVDEPYLNDFKKQFYDGKLAKTYGSFPLTNQLDESNRDFFVALAEQNKAFTVDANRNPSFTVEVPQGQYYLMGDDRTISSDSRMVGTFSRDKILGVVKLRIWPINKIGTIE